MPPLGCASGGTAFSAWLIIAILESAPVLGLLTFLAGWWPPAEVLAVLLEAAEVELLLTSLAEKLPFVVLPVVEKLFSEGDPVVFVDAELVVLLVPEELPEEVPAILPTLVLVDAVDVPDEFEPSLTACEPVA